jgi:hypothetical protein
MLSCYKCKEIKDKEFFYEVKSRSTGYASICKPCASLVCKERRKNNPEYYRNIASKIPKEKLAAYDKKYYWADVEKTRRKKSIRTCTPEYREKRKEADKRYREKNKDHISELKKNQRLKHLDKMKCRSKFYHQVRIGNIIRPKICENCGQEKKIEGHHEDYNKPFDVIWLCKLCHGAKHKKYKEVKND